MSFPCEGFNADRLFFIAFVLLVYVCKGDGWREKEKGYHLHCALLCNPLTAVGLRAFSG